jgi:acetyltransferase-like isoleucine patch superfamily enzyme
VTVGYDATLSVGAGTFLNDGSAVWCDSATTIGPGCAISWGVRILDSDLHRLMRDGEPSPDAPVRIGQGCWIGANALIMKGAQLGDGSVVAAGAVVTSEVPPRSLVAGVPARVRRENVTWVR